ncbi:unnamed protein product [Brassica napus]|uniref:(rape) hypothetical protein n=1 Tax=Brassica napus TaxID=3708 RepID=A0A816IQN8_BRANA|nr:unnamed protein product [Brassica napus]
MVGFVIEAFEWSLLLQRLAAATILAAVDAIRFGSSLRTL